MVIEIFSDTIDTSIGINKTFNESVCMLYGNSQGLNNDWKRLNLLTTLGLEHKRTAFASLKVNTISLKQIYLLMYSNNKTGFQHKGYSNKN